MSGPRIVGGGLNAAEAARRAEEARQRAEAARRAAEAARRAAEEASKSARPKANAHVSAFDGAHRKQNHEKLFGFTAPAPHAAQGLGAAQAPGGSGEPRGAQQPPASLDAVDARDAQAARRVPDGQTFTDPSSGTKYQVRQNASSGETVLSDPATGSTVTLKADGSFTASATTTDKTGTTTWTKTSDAQGRPTGLQSQQRATGQHPETGATTTTTTTTYDAGRSPPVPRSRTDEVQMERPPPALAQRPGTPQGPVTVKSETQFNEQGLPARQVKTTEVRTPGFNAKDVGALEAGTGGAFDQASKGEGHYAANKAPTHLKPGESSLTITEETLFNAKGEPAVSKQKTDSVAVTPLASDTNGNGVQVVRTQQQVDRGPVDAGSTAGLPALSARTPGKVDSRTTVTGYDPDGSRLDKGHASRTQTVSRSSGTTDASGQLQLKHAPMEVKSLQEGGRNRWTYDHVSVQVGADGKPVAGQKPKELDRERQLPWHEDVKDFMASGVRDLAEAAGALASDALAFAKDRVLDPLSSVVDDAAKPLEDSLADEIKKLDSEGDTLTLNGGLDVKLGLKGGLEGEAEIERTADGKYQLSAEVTGNFGIGVVGSAYASAGGRMEFKFDTPEEAARAAIILGKGAAAGAEDQKFLRERLTAMEVNLGVGLEAGVGAKFGPGGAELSASLDATTGYRVEFDKGKPTYLVRTTEVEGAAAGELATGLKGKLGLSLGGEVSGTFSIESKIPLDASKVDGKDVLAFLGDPTGGGFTGPAETSLTLEGTVDTGNQGRFYSAEVSGLSSDELRSITQKMVDGDFGKALDDVDAEVKVSEGSFKDRELGLGAKLGVVDFNVSARHRDATSEGGTGNGSSTVTVGKGKRGGGEGPQGSSGPKGGAPAGETGTQPSTQPGAQVPPTTYKVNPATGGLVANAGVGSAATPRPSDVRPGAPLAARPGDIIGQGRNGPIRMMGGAAPTDPSNALPQGVPPWVAAVLPPGYHPRDVSVQGSMVTTGTMNQELMNPRPNTAYWVDNRFLYVTDAQGRVAFVEGLLPRPQRGVRNNTVQRQGAVTDNVGIYEGDRGGHLIGAQYGGPPEAINYVPQTRRQNDVRPRSEHRPRDGMRNWYDFEMQNRPYLLGGNDIRVRVTPEYIGNGTNRPDRLIVDALLMGTPQGNISNRLIFPN